MGSRIEFNDTLQLSEEQGFPRALLDLEQHQRETIELDDLETTTFSWSKDEARVFHLAPCRCFLVENRNGKWIHWGHVQIRSQTINYDPETDTHTTSGTAEIISIHTPDYQKQLGKYDTPSGRNYFAD